MKYLMLAFLLFSSTACADEVITGFDTQKDLPVLNEELRKLDEANQSLASRIAVLEADTGASAATQAQMEAATSTTVYASPGRTQYHPGVAKAWCVFNGATVGTNAPTAGYNVDSVTRNGTGDYTITFGTDFSSGNYVMAGSALATSAGNANFVTIKNGTTPAVGSITIQVGHGEFTVDDTTIVTLAFFGDQ